MFENRNQISANSVTIHNFSINFPTDGCTDMPCLTIKLRNLIIYKKLPGKFFKRCHKNSSLNLNQLCKIHLNLGELFGVILGGVQGLPRLCVWGSFLIAAEEPSPYQLHTIQEH